jgi:hypothetical protein
MEEKIKELEMRVKELERMVELEMMRKSNGMFTTQLKHDWNEYVSNFVKKINYTIGDKVASIHNPDKVIGTCTGFIHNDTCIMIDEKCWGGKYYFTKINN